jgi:hypothetical protein
MKKILIVFIVAISCSQIMIAQTKNASGNQQKKIAAQEILTTQQKLEVISKCPELLNQLTTKFGKNFSPEDPNVISLLKSNTTDKSVDPAIMKLSIYLMSHSKSN